MPAIGSAELSPTRLAPAGQTAIALPTITLRTQKEQRLAFIGITKPLPQDRLAVCRHAFSQAAMDNRSNFVAG